MVAKYTSSTSNPTPNRISFFGPPPLLEGEDPKAYDQLLAGITGCIKPTDFVEEIWINEIVNQTWEIIRWKKLKAAILNDGMAKALERFLIGPLGLPYELEFTVNSPPNTARTLAYGWAAKESSEVKQVEDLLTSCGRTIEFVQGRALELKLDVIERIDRLIISAEACRIATFKEIDRHRDRKEFAAVLRKRIANVDDAEFQTLAIASPNAQANGGRSRGEQKKTRG